MIARRVLGHVPMSLVSQAFNSVTNLVLAVLVARASTPSEYGVWAIGYAIYVLALQVQRAVVSTPILLIPVEEQPTVGMRNPVLGASLGAGVIFSLTAVAIIPFVDGSHSVLIVFAALIPLLLIQDAIRHLAFRDRRGIEAAGVDLLWVVLQLVGFTWLLAAGEATGFAVTLVWAGSAAASALVWWAWRRVPLTVTATRQFLRDNRSASTKLLVESLLGTGVLQLLPMLLAVTAGLVVAGGMRASQTVFGPITFVIMGITPLMTTAVVGRVAREQRYGHLLWALTGTVAAAAVGGLVILELVPGVGRALVGDSWALVAGILLPATIVAGLRGIIAGVPIVLRAQHRLNETITLRIRTAAPALALPVAGAYLAGLEGAAWGAAAATAVNALQSLRSLRHRAPAPG